MVWCCDYNVLGLKHHVTFVSAVSCHPCEYLLLEPTREILSYETDNGIQFTDKITTSTTPGNGKKREPTAHPF